MVAGWLAAPLCWMLAGAVVMFVFCVGIESTRK